MDKEIILNLEYELSKMQKKINKLEAKLSIADSLIVKVYASLEQYSEHIKESLEVYIKRSNT
jgi:cell division protein ZapA (FtsZ GTPase activity inhibitor)